MAKLVSNCWRGLGKGATFIVGLVAGGFTTIVFEEFGRSDLILGLAQADSAPRFIRDAGIIGTRHEVFSITITNRSWLGSGSISDIELRPFAKERDLLELELLTHNSQKIRSYVSSFFIGQNDLDLRISTEYQNTTELNCDSPNVYPYELKFRDDHDRSIPTFDKLPTAICMSSLPLDATPAEQQTWLDCTNVLCVELTSRRFKLAPKASFTGTPAQWGRKVAECKVFARNTRGTKRGCERTRENRDII